MLTKVMKPEIFQGERYLRRPGAQYFEGWYCKQVSADGRQVLALIPGISLGSDPHSFIQLINGRSGETAYARYPLSAFRYARNSFDVSVGESRFTRRGIEVDIRQEGTVITGKLDYRETVPWPGTITAPGIMGWYGYVPVMECYHGAVSLDHRVEGSLTVNGSCMDFSGGKGYIEKDWGKGFPSAWIWMQSNHFGARNASFMLSVARVPWRGKSFTGFLGFLYMDGTTIPIATWKSHSLTLGAFDELKAEIDIRLGRHESMKVRAVSKKAAPLNAPRTGTMDRIIKESVMSEIEILYFRKDRTTERLFTDLAGLEIVHPGELV
ncbi:MAG: hypothetical protein JXB03_09780 [Spirochaetales bacterium]|nr:hypothetical protein [Spirochaetales bacterium]